MNQAVTGAFIAIARKKKGLTQRQLADELNVSDKAISKWETGNGFPDISLMVPLCKTLNINVNELLTGEYLTDEQYKEKAEQNMVDMIKERTENVRRMKLNVLVGISTLLSFVTLLVVVEKFGSFMAANVKIALIAIAIISFAIGIYVVMQGEINIGYYHCKKCNEYFVPTTASYILGVHTLTRRHLRCPKCKKMRWCKKVLSKSEENK